jgi:hypothetical protein
MMAIILLPCLSFNDLNPLGRFERNLAQKQHVTKMAKTSQIAKESITLKQDGSS